MRDISLSAFRPRSELVLAEHPVQRARFPVVDFHTHLFHSDALGGVEAVRRLAVHRVVAAVNVCGRYGPDLAAVLAKSSDQRSRLLTFGAVDATRLDEPGFHRYVAAAIREARDAGMVGLKYFKSLGLGLRDSSGALIRPDSPRLKPIWETAAELRLPVLIHIADPIAFFRPIDGSNERFEELGQRPDWSFSDPQFPSFAELMDMQERLLAENPHTTFIVAHVGSASEDLGLVSRHLARYPNMYVDIAARISELGRQPYTARRFLEEHQDRIVFGTDISDYSIAADECGHHYPYYFRFLETMDEHFDYDPHPGQGRWRIYGIGLPDDILRKVYYQNAVRLLPDVLRVEE